MWQQRLFHQSYKAWTLIGGQWASGEPDRRLQLAPEHTTGGRLRQSIWKASLANFRSWYQLLIAQWRAKWGTVIRENPTRRFTYNPAGDGFHRLVENWPDSDGRVG